MTRALTLPCTGGRCLSCQHSVVVTHCREWCARARVPGGSSRSDGYVRCARLCFRPTCGVVASRTFAGGCSPLSVGAFLTGPESCGEIVRGGGVQRHTAWRRARWTWGVYCQRLCRSPRSTRRFVRGRGGRRQCGRGGTEPLAAWRKAGGRWPRPHGPVRGVTPTPPLNPSCVACFLVCLGSGLATLAMTTLCCHPETRQRCWKPIAGGALRYHTLVARVAGTRGRPAAARRMPRAPHPRARGAARPRLTPLTPTQASPLVAGSVATCHGAPAARSPRASPAGAASPRLQAPPALALAPAQLGAASS